jgi:hypothetical protein
MRVTAFIQPFFAAFMILFKHKYNMHMSCLSIFFAEQPGVGIGDSADQLGHSDSSQRKHCEPAWHRDIGGTSAALSAL